MEKDAAFERRFQQVCGGSGEAAGMKGQRGVKEGIREAGRDVGRGL